VGHLQWYLTTTQLFLRASKKKSLRRTVANKRIVRQNGRLTALIA